MYELLDLAEHYLPGCTITPDNDPNYILAHHRLLDKPLQVSVGLFFDEPTYYQERLYGQLRRH